MKITYINHSCFLVELRTCLLLFDYYSEGLKGDGPVPGIDKLPDKKLYVFVSHKHPDHFDKRIFELEKIHAVTYYLISKDAKMNQNYIRKKGISESAWEKMRFVGKDENIELDKGIAVMTLASTDRGVAFLVKAEGNTIYHAGDLNWWSWEGETEECERDMERRFKHEVKKLSEVVIDVAFLPLDPRQKDRFYWGFDYFMRQVKVKAAYPMHFWGDRTVIERLREMEASEEYRDKIMVPI